MAPRKPEAKLHCATSKWGSLGAPTGPRAGPNKGPKRVRRAPRWPPRRPRVKLHCATCLRCFAEAPGGPRGAPKKCAKRLSGGRQDCPGDAKRQVAPRIAPWGALCEPRQNPEESQKSALRVSRANSKTTPSVAKIKLHRADIGLGGRMGSSAEPRGIHGESPARLSGGLQDGPQRPTTQCTASLGLRLCGNSYGAPPLGLGCLPPRRRPCTLTPYSRSAFLLILLSWSSASHPPRVPPRPALPPNAIQILRQFLRPPLPSIPPTSSRNPQPSFRFPSPSLCGGAG